MNTTKQIKSFFARGLAILVCFIMCFTFIPWMDNSGATVEASETLKLGDYVQMGEYYGKPILWRCVAFYKVDDYGNVDLDATSDRYEEGYLPLMLSDKILCIKPFDAGGTVTKNFSSHGRGYFYEDLFERTKKSVRQQDGSNCWEDSNMRCWLNSTASAGNVFWTCGNKPNKENLNIYVNKLGLNAYDREAGFLSNFTQSEINCMKKVSQYQLLDRYEYDDMRVYGTTYHIQKLNSCFPIDDCVTNFDEAYKKTITDTMFLLDVKQVNQVYLNLNNYYIGEPTAKCVENSEYIDEDLATGKKWHYWLRTPDAFDGGGNAVLHVFKDGVIYGDARAYRGDYGVRPAFYLNLSSSVIVSGDGTESSPYIVEEAANPNALKVVLSGAATIAGLTIVKTLLKTQTIKPFLAFDQRVARLFILNRIFKIIF